MSEYQYYEFRAIDRPLTDKQIDELGKLSTRAEITPTSFTNTYRYGDFRGDPKALMENYFDAFVYVANWGTRRLMFRVPLNLLDVAAATAYCDGESVVLKTGKDMKHGVIEISSHDDSEDWIDGEAWMASLISIRDELIRGDLRALYIGWLATLEASGEFTERPEDDAVEPPVPPGLTSLSGALERLAEFLGVGDALLEVAASASLGSAPSGPTPAEMESWIKGLPPAEKDAYLLRFVAQESDALLRSDITARFREATKPTDKKPIAESKGRTVGELRAAAESLFEQKKRKAAETKAKKEAADRKKHLDDVASRAMQIWTEIESLLTKSSTKSYDKAVQHLVDLRDLADRSNQVAQFSTRIQELRRVHKNKHSLIKKFDVKKLA
jgi:hypothetical protein